MHADNNIQDPKQDKPDSMKETHSQTVGTSRNNNPLPEDGELISPQSFSPASGKTSKQSIGIKTWHIATTSALIVLGLVATFLFMARAVTIETFPAEAEVAITGGMALPFGEGHLVLRGQYQLTAIAEGYVDLEQTMDIGAEQNQIITLELQKLPGHLTINFPNDDSNNATETEAEIWIDGKMRGNLNREIRNIAAGEHSVDVVTERYLPFTSLIDITGLNQSQTMNIELEPAWGNVQFVTQPLGAELFVDNEFIATTPVMAEILQGEREVLIKMPGYKSWYDVLVIEAGDEIQIPPVRLESADGMVKIDSKPARASVTINNNYYGQTPIEVALAPGSTYQLTLFKDGFQPAQRKITVSSNQAQDLNINLSPQVGDIRVKASPADALLYVEGRLMGRADQTLHLPASQTQITVKKDGYADYQTTVLPRPNLEQLVSINLKTLEEAKWENIPDQIKTKAGQGLKLFKPQHTFTMGSSRREQGRRANEALYDVELTRPFYLGLNEVTNRQFRAFDANHSSGNVKGNSLNGENQPVANVSWQQAALYCNWLSDQENLPHFYLVEEEKVAGFNPQANGYRLPTEAEWVWAARLKLKSPETLLKYSWGQQITPPAAITNIADRNAAQLVGFIQATYDDGFSVSAPTGTFPANDKGVFDLDGNIAEWLSDYYDVPSSLTANIDKDPFGPSSGNHHVIRGPSWAHGSITELRLSFRDYGSDARRDVGFRVARFVD